MTDAERAAFDTALDDVLAAAPPVVARVLESVSLIVLDRPDAELLEALGADPDDHELASELCGLHSGVSITERAIEAPDLPSQIHIFREGVVQAAGGWADTDAISEQIRITLLHEIGHEMGLDEDDLTDLGYE